MMSDRYLRGILDFPNELELISQVKAPTQVCYAAGKAAILAKSSERYFNYLQTDKMLVGIDGAKPLIY